MRDDQAFQQRMQRIETLIHHIETFEPAARASAEELVQSLMDLYSAGMERMLDIAWETGEPGQAIIDQCGQDELVGSLLMLHGLHPLDLETRVLQALDSVRPYLRSHGGNVELVDITNGVVRLQLEGTCQGCPSSQVTLKYAIEEAIHKAAPDVVAIEAVGATPKPPPRPPSFIPMAELMADGDPRGFHKPLGPEILNGGWVAVDGLGVVTEGALRTVDVSGRSVLFCRVGETYYAYGNTCPSCGGSLGQTKLAGKDIACPTCGHRYDIMRAGRDLDEPRLHLQPYPLLEEFGAIKVALPHA